MLSFEPIYFRDKLKLINPQGFIGMVTLWSNPNWVLKQLTKIGVDLSPKTSVIAVIGNLRGNGFPHFIRNLLYNPQITHLACCGRNRYGSLEDIISFFAEGIEEIEGKSPYSLNGKLVPAVRIKGRIRMIDSLVRPDDFTHKPKINSLGELNDKTSLGLASNYFKDLENNAQLSDTDCSATVPRRNIPLPDVHVDELPCNPRAFVIKEKHVVKAWEELIYVLHRFGRVAHLMKGDRKELQNVKVIVEEPTATPDERLLRYWFTEDKIRKYQNEILSGKKPIDETYTYGHRLRSYFGMDCLGKVVERLLKDKEDRKCYISLWDTAHDLEGNDPPCLVALFFRLYEGRLTLCATYRTHNSMDAWIYNFFGLKAVLDFVANETNMDPGAITVISNSISIDMDESTIARASLLVERSRKPAIIMDPHGQFGITVDPKNSEIIVQHCSKDGLLLKEYRGKKAQSIQHKLYKDMAISDVNHAMYIGRQLAKAELSIKYNFEFIQA